MIEKIYNLIRNALQYIGNALALIIFFIIASLALKSLVNISFNTVLVTKNISFTDSMLVIYCTSIILVFIKIFTSDWNR
jgi:hypothetical protein